MPQDIPLADNVLRFLRSRNVFSPESVGPNLETGQGTFTGEPVTPQFPSPPPVTGTRPMDSMQRMNELYQPDTRAIDKLYGMLDQIPERNKPGLLRKIAGVAAAFSPEGPKAVEQTLYAPYHRQMQDFQAKFEPTRQVAEQERGSNTNLRQIASSVLSNERQLEAMRQRDDQFYIREDRLRRVANARLEIQREVALGGTTQFTPKGDMIIVRRDGSVIPVDYDVFSPQEKMELQAKYARETAAVPRTTITSGSTTTSTVTPPEAEQPTQAKQRMINNAAKLLNERPELREIISFNPDTGLPEVPPVGTLISGNWVTEWFGAETKRLTQEDIDKINEALNTGKPPEAARTSTSISNRTSTSRSGGRAPVVAPNAATVPAAKGTVRVKAPDGRTGTWDLSKGPIPKGFVEIP